MLEPPKILLAIAANVQSLCGPVGGVRSKSSIGEQGLSDDDASDGWQSAVACAVSGDSAATVAGHPSTGKA